MNYTLFRTVAWRLIRTALATALVQTLALNVDWSNPEQAARTLLISFGAGFLTALGAGIRDHFGNKSKTGMIHKIPV